LLPRLSSYITNHGRIRVEDRSNGQNVATSGVFTIAKASGAGKPQIIAPQSGQQLPAGKPHLITWTVPGDAKKVFIQVRWGAGQPFVTIGTALANQPFFLWNVLPGQPFTPNTAFLRIVDDKGRASDTVAVTLYKP
jgi:hypothetical protein